MGWFDDIKRRSGQGAASVGPAQPRRRKRPSLPRYIWLWFLVALLVNFVVTRYIVPPADEPIVVPYTVFKAQVAAGNVAEIYAQGANVVGVALLVSPYRDGPSRAVFDGLDYAPEART